MDIATITSALADTAILDGYQQQRIEAFDADGKHAQADALRANPITSPVISQDGAYFTMFVYYDQYEQVLAELKGLDGVIVQDLRGSARELEDKGVSTIALNIPAEREMSVLSPDADAQVLADVTELRQTLSALAGLER